MEDTFWMVALLAIPFLVTMGILSVSYLPPSGSKKIHVGANTTASIVLAAAGAGTFWWWGVVFEAAETGATIASGADRAMVVGFWVGVVAFAVIMLIGISSASENAPVILDWHRLTTRLFDQIRKTLGLRCHWLMELQRRGAPHCTWLSTSIQAPIMHIMSGVAET